jgi:hypothetical protein
MPISTASAPRPSARPPRITSSSSATPACSHASGVEPTPTTASCPARSSASASSWERPPPARPHKTSPRGQTSRRTQASLDRSYVLFRQLRLGRQAQGRRPAGGFRAAHRPKRRACGHDRAGRVRRARGRARDACRRPPARARRQTDRGGLSTSTEARDGLHRDELGEERADAPVEFVADHAHLFERSPAGSSSCQSS